MAVSTKPHLLHRGVPAAAPVPREPQRFFRWREDWRLGVRAMDDDHRRLAALLDGIAGEIGEDGEPIGDGFALLPRLLVLGRATRAHFAREEALMRTADYPHLAAHKCEHDLLLAEFTELVREVAVRGADGLDRETLGALKAWFLGHLLDSDRRLALYLRGVGIETPH